MADCANGIGYSDEQPREIPEGNAENITDEKIRYPGTGISLKK
jgi:hypothetical protein